MRGIVGTPAHGMARTHCVQPGMMPGRWQAVVSDVQSCLASGIPVNSGIDVLSLYFGL